MDMDDRLDTKRIRYFMQVLDSGSVRGAAEVLGMDPSALSRAVAQLERECGTRLLERRGRGVAPTDAGELLASYARRQNGQKQQLLAQMDSIQKVERGHIDIVAGEGFIDWLMRFSLRRFLLAHPRITVNLDVGSTDEIVQRIVDERDHIGMLFQPPRDERLRSHHSHPQPIQALFMDSHPLARETHPLRLADLQPYPGAALQRGFGVRQRIEAAEIAEGVRLNTVFTTSSFSAAGRFVAAGLGYALITRLSLPPHLDTADMIARPMHNPLLNEGRTHVVSRHGRVLSPAADTLLRMIVQDIRAEARRGQA